MATRSEIVACARAWISTPYRHQAATRGAGADCLGLVRGVWREIYGDEPEAVPAYSMDWSEPQGEEQLWAAAARHLTVKSGPPEPGDVILFRMRASSVAKHLGIFAQAGPEFGPETGLAARFVHTYGKHGVVESPLSAPWRRRIVAAFEFPQEVL